MPAKGTARSNWLKVTTVDGFTLESLVQWLENSIGAVVAYEKSCHELIARIRSVYNVLEALEKRTKTLDEFEDSKFLEQLRDFVEVAYRLRQLIKRFSDKPYLHQLIRSEKIKTCVQEGYDCAGPFVDGIQGSDFAETFSEIASSLSIETINLGDWSQVLWSNDVDTMRQALKWEISAANSENESLLEVREKVACILKFEAQRIHRQGIVRPLFGIGESQFMDQAQLMPWLIPSDEISLGRKIGKGGYAVVLLGMFQEKTQVIVKRLTKLDKTLLLREISIWYQLKYPHILQFYGATHLDLACNIVSEFAQHGQLGRYWVNLDGSIDSNRKKQLWRFFYEAALGLHYMHGQGFVHGDLKCDNILIGEDLKAKLVDFGLSFKNGDHQNVLCSAAVHWAAPECLDKTRTTERSFSTDVYMFGMCIVEALIGGPPYDGGAKAPNLLCWVGLSHLPEGPALLWLSYSTPILH